jgi:tRNA uridine 5-carboxymethylaminomethyl modification enzyme
MGLNGQIILVIKLWWWKSGRKCFAWNTEDLINAGFEAGRMKTGTPPSGWTFFGLFENERRKGDAKPDKFSYSDLTLL